MSAGPAVPPPEADLQFERVEYAQGQSAGAMCSQCAQPLSDAYYQVNDRPACERCRSDMELAERHGVGGGFGRFVRSTLFGGLAAIVGAAVWFGIRALTGYDLGLIAVAVGLLVGAAVRAGARGRGGWRYQTLAVFLTYSAVAATYVPPVLQGLKEQATKAETAPAAVPEAAATASAAPVEVTPAVASASPEGGESRAFPGVFVLALGVVLILVLAYVAPFLILAEGVNGLIGLAIVFFALYEAWKLNRRVPVVVCGPYRLAPAGTTAPPPPPDDVR